MKIAHWTLKNGAGMHRVAEDISNAEVALGYHSVVCRSDDKVDWEGGIAADVHVVHSHLPDPVKSGKIVWIGHGTPEHCFQGAVEAGLSGGYGAGDPFMLAQYWLQHSDAAVTFWPRHKAIWESLMDKGRPVNHVPLGVNKDFWKPIESRGKFAGNPSLLTLENCHYIKWPLDLLLMWPWVTESISEARLHVSYLPRDQHRWWFPLINRNGAAFKTFVSANIFSQEDLKNAFTSVDSYIGLVRYGDFNRVCLEAKALGCKVISYRGNPYADYWLSEGDQRVMARELIEILNRNVKPRKTEEVPDIKETAKAMIKIYEGIL